MKAHIPTDMTIGMKNMYGTFIEERAQFKEFLKID